MSYEIIEAPHIISIIAWMAGLLYLPRLFVYHADTPLGSVQAETFKVMERRLLKAIMTPAMITSFIFGIWLLVSAPALLTEIWMIIKIVCVFGLAGCQGLFSRMRRDLENDKLPYSSKVYRIWNEAPTLLMIIIVIMAVVKPDFT